jgi:hypothetical protein
LSFVFSPFSFTFSQGSIHTGKHQLISFKEKNMKRGKKKAENVREKGGKRK